MFSSISLIFFHRRVCMAEHWHSHAYPFLPYSLHNTHLPHHSPFTHTHTQDRVEDKFLGSDLGNLVDLDSLTIPPPILNNPFGMTGISSSEKPANPFDANKTSGPSLNQIAVSSNPSYSASGKSGIRVLHVIIHVHVQDQYMCKYIYMYSTNGIVVC